MRSSRPWVLVAPTSALAPLAPLLAARARRQPLHVIENGVEAVLANAAPCLPPDTEAVLVIGPRRGTPRRGLAGLFWRDRDGQRVPVGWLPEAGAALANYAAAAAKVLLRPSTPGPLVILGQWEDRFLRVALRTSRWFERHESALPVFHWTADRVSRTDMLRGLGVGPGVALYFGHGRPRGWAGYHGTRASHFETPWDEAIGALLALCCENASRWRTGVSFAEDLALRGVVAGALAAVTKTRHEDNRLLGPALCETLTQPGETVSTLAELVAKTEVPAGFWERSPYRFIGDPAAPLAGAAHAPAKAAAIFAPAPDAVLPAWPD